MLANVAEQIAFIMGVGRSNDARYHLMSIPRKWRDDKNSLLYRHRDEGSANFAFADGHVKWLKTNKLRYAAGSTVPGVWTLQEGD